MEQTLKIILSIQFGLVLMSFIFLKPYLGIIFTLVSLPVVDLLPEIPFLTSIVMLIGAVTLAGFLFQRKKGRGRPLFSFGRVHIVGLLFIGWIFLSNPQAAWFGADRNWLLTFFQLWILIWLAGELLDSPQKQHILMWLFSIVSAIAAVIAIQQGHIGDTVGMSFRASGLAGNPNSTARYLVVAMIFFSYLGTITNRPVPRLLAFGGAIVTFLGVFFTLSRTGIILLIVATGLQIILGARQRLRVPLILTYLVASLAVWFSSEKIINIIKSIVPSIQQGTDTIGLRYSLWQAALHMWSDHVLQGVGIGRFASELRYYAPTLPARYWSLGAHNTYVNVLAETGLVGLVFFILLIVLSLSNYLRGYKSENHEDVALRHAWLIVFLIVLLGETTLNGTHDKLLWLLMGVSLCFQTEFFMGRQKVEPQTAQAYGPYSQGLS